MLASFGIARNDIPQLGQPPLKRLEITFVVDGGFVHMIEDLLCEGKGLASQQIGPKEVTG